jgi:hypothetical protein
LAKMKLFQENIHWNPNIYYRNASWKRIGKKSNSWWSIKFEFSF